MFVVKGQYAKIDETLYERFGRPMFYQCMLLSIAYVLSFAGYTLYIFKPEYLWYALTSASFGTHVFSSSVTAWISVSSIAWVACIASTRYPRYASMWYWIIMALMTLTLIFGMFLLPEVSHHMSRMIFATVPLQALMFIFMRFLRPEASLLIPIIGVGIFMMIIGPISTLFPS